MLITAIDRLRDEYYFLSMLSNSEIKIGDKIHNSIYDAYVFSKEEFIKEVIEANNYRKIEKNRKDERYNAIILSWEQIRFFVMKSLIKNKFSDPVLKEKLKNTLDSEIVDNNLYHDNFWGNCTCKKCKDIVGKNNYGKLLMEVRNEL